MATFEELRKHSRELQEKIFDLEKYQSKFRHLHGEISEYKYNPHRDQAHIPTLQEELRCTKKQLRAEYGIGENKIADLLKQYNSELSTDIRSMQTLEEKKPELTVKESIFKALYEISALQPDAPDHDRER
jgi:hypothetical protein